MYFMKCKLLIEKVLIDNTHHTNIDICEKVVLLVLYGVSMSSGSNNLRLIYFLLFKRQRKWY